MRAFAFTPPKLQLTNTKPGMIDHSPRLSVKGELQFFVNEPRLENAVRKGLKTKVPLTSKIYADVFKVCSFDCLVTQWFFVISFLNVGQGNNIKR